MEIAIKVLDVGDADAIILHLKKEGEVLVAMIDCGKPGDHKLVLTELQQTLNDAKKKSPDFIICTHYDNDHIGGLELLINVFMEYKPVVWMHKTSMQMDIEQFKQNLKPMKESIFPSEGDSYLGGSMGNDQHYFVQAIKTVEQEQAVIRLLGKLSIDCKEPLVENFYIEGWPELSVVSPDSEFYQQLFPKKFSTSDLLKAEVEYLKAEDRALGEAEDPKDPFLALDQLKRTKITPTNMNSAMLMLKVNGKKLLFSADAGIAAFERIPEETLKDLYWLKVPHHGSSNNMNSDLIKLMKPLEAVISGKNRISKELVACLREVGSKVSSTREYGHVAFNETL